MKFPNDLKYTKNDEWIRVEGNVGTLGVSDYAQDQLSDIVYIEYAVSVGDEQSAGDIFGTVESVKAASDVYFPVGGKVIELNESLLDAPEMVNSDPYEKSWMIKIEISDLSELDGLMDSSAYETKTKERDA